MARTCLVLLVLLAMAMPAFAAPPEEKDRNDSITDPPKKYTGRPGELSEEEEEKIDEIIKRFIEFDTGRSPRDKESQMLLNKLGPEAIPALVRGVNKSAKESHSCPILVIGKKLATLIGQSEDPKVLEFIRNEVGAGVSKTPYDNVLGQLRLKATYRKRKVEADIKAAQTTPGDKTSPGQPKSPGEEKPK